MLRGSRFRLKTPTLAIMSKNGQDVRVTIPAGAIVQVVIVPEHQDCLVDVAWKDKTLMMSPADIHERGEQVPAFSR